LDVSVHVEAELRLRQRETRLSAVFNHTSDAMLLFTVEKGGGFRVAAANKSFMEWAKPLAPVTEAQLLGLTVEQMAGEVFAKPGALDKHLERMRQAVASRGPCTFDNTVAFPGGARFAEVTVVPVLDDAGECAHVLWSSRDVTERVTAEQARVKLETKLRQAAKMEAVGRLAGGVAHDFNNLLSVILSYCELSMRGLRQGDPLAREMGEIRHAGERAAELTRQLLAFSRQQVSSPRILSLNTVLVGMEPMLRRLIGEDIELRVITEPSLWLCRIDPGQVEQIVMNLIVNARDAMQSGGAITLETGNVVLDEAYAREHPDAVAGPHAVLAITDTGVGMAPDVIAHIFEPFFTTKAMGVGTGLGLATVYGIVRQAGGNVWVYSEPDKGTTFKVYLPRIDGAPTDEAPAQPAIADLRGTETILIVEDDEAVRRVIHGILSHAGYHVIDASNGGEALLVCEQHGATISLLLTDVVMPRLNGRKLAERLQQSRPNLKVVFMSGYTENSIVHDGVLDSGINFLSKPITPDALLRKVREVLGKS
jgi:PAS domain S-box-containing protein